MRLLGSMIVLGLLGTFVACSNDANQSSSQIKSESIDEVLTLKNVTAAECGIWGEEYQKRPRMIEFTDMSCPGSVKAHQTREECGDFNSCLTIGAGAEVGCRFINGSLRKIGHCDIVGSCHETYYCDIPDKPATCQRQDGLEDDTSKPKVRIVGPNGQTVKTCEIYKDAQELKAYLNGRQESVKSNLSSAIELEGNYYATQNSKTELACLIQSLDSVALKESVEKLKAKYKTIFGTDVLASESCKNGTLSTLAKATPSDGDESSLAKAMRKFKQLNQILSAETKNLGLLYENTKDKAYGDSEKKALSDLQQLLKQHGRQ